MPDKSQESEWLVYILQCNDDSYYTGVTTDIARRLDEHNKDDKKAAKYTRMRRPVSLVYKERCHDRRAACKREYEIKQLTRLKKKQLIDSSATSIL